MSTQPIKTVIDNSFNIIKILKRNLLKELSKSGSYYNDKKKEDLIRFRKEFSTVKISLPRRMGNTTLAIRCFKEFKKSILISSIISVLFSDPRISKKDRNRMATPRSLLLRGIKTDVVILDCASYVSKKDIENVYEIDAEFYIFLE
jgi:hypothetical protein